MQLVEDKLNEGVYTPKLIHPVKPRRPSTHVGGLTPTQMRDLADQHEQYEVDSAAYANAKRAYMEEQRQLDEKFRLDLAVENDLDFKSAVECKVWDRACQLADGEDKAAIIRYHDMLSEIATLALKGYAAPKRS